MTAQTLGRVRTVPILRALGTRDFRLLWASEALSVVGDQFQFVALSWLVISLTGSGMALGAVLIAVGVPRGDPADRGRRALPADDGVAGEATSRPGG